METALFLLVDGITSGAVYGLVALSLILIYTVTRVVNIAQGEFVTLGALSFASILGGAFAPLAPIAMAGIAIFSVADAVTLKADLGARFRLVAGRTVWIALIAAVSTAAWANPGSYTLAAIAAVATTAALGPVLYRLSVEPAADASPIVLLIISVGVYMVLHGSAVLIWGAEPKSVPPIAAGGIVLGPVFVAYQSLWICILSLAVMAGLYLFSERTVTGQAIQAAAVNRVGAQLCGIPVSWAGQLSFALSAAFSALSGLLLAPLVTAHYDMGFTIGLKGFVGAALGGIVEYPTALIGVVFVGAVESFSAYNVSSFKDAVVYLLVIPILLWRNAFRPPQEH